MDYALALIVPIALILQAILALRLPSRGKALIWTTFTATAVLYVLLGLWAVREKRMADSEAKGLRAQVGSVQAMLQAAQLTNAADMGYLRGRLDALVSKPSDVGQLAGAITKAASEIARRETRRLSDEQLSKSTMDLAKRMRIFESKYRARDYAATDSYMQAIQRAKPEERTGIFNQHVAQLTQSSLERDLEFRNTLLGEAVYFRNELQRRLQLTDVPPKDRHRIIAFDGILAGPSPVSDAADYLEQLARQLNQPH